MSVKKKREYNMKTDTKYGWVVVASAFMIRFITDGLPYTFGILMVELLKQFQEDRAKTAFIISVMLCTKHLAGPLISALCERYGHRVVAVAGSIVASIGFVISAFADSILYLTVTYGFLGGLGFGLVYIPSSICVLQHFEKHRSKALGVAACGSGVGSFCISHLSRFLINHYGWRGTLLIEAGIVMNCAVCGLLLKQPESVGNRKSLETNDAPSQTFEEYSGKEEEIDAHEPTHNQSGEMSAEDINDNEDKSKENNTFIDNNIPLNSDRKDQTFGLIRFCDSLFSLNLLKDVRCWLFLLSTVMYELAFIIPVSFLPDQGIGIGMSKDETSWLISAIGICNTVSRVCVGLIGDIHFVNRMVLLEVILFQTSLSTGFSFCLRKFAMKMLYSCFYGFLVGGFVVLYPVVLADVFGVKMISKAYGFMMLSTGIGAIMAAPFGGMLFDSTSSYDLSFVIAGVEFLLSGLLLVALHIILKRKEKGNECRNNEIHE